MTCSSAWSSTSTMPGFLMVSFFVLVPFSNSISCSGVECTWISPEVSASMSSVIGSPTFALTRSPLGVTLPSLIVILTDVDPPSEPAALLSSPQPVRPTAAMARTAAAASDFLIVFLRAAWCVRWSKGRRAVALGRPGGRWLQMLFLEPDQHPQSGRHTGERPGLHQQEQRRVAGSPTGQDKNASPRGDARFDLLRTHTAGK